MAREITIKLYQFDELDRTAKENARSWWRKNCDFDTDFILDNIKQCASILGILMDANHLSPITYQLGCQGAFAAINGSYSYAKGSRLVIREHAPQDIELHKIADRLMTIQRRNFYRASARLTSGWCCNSQQVTVYDIADADEPYLVNALQDFAGWIESWLTTEYEYQYSDEYTDDAIRINEYEFTETGKRV